MLHACVQKFNMTENFENFWELNGAVVERPALLLLVSCITSIKEETEQKTLEIPGCISVVYKNVTWRWKIAKKRSCCPGPPLLLFKKPLLLGP